MVDYARLAHEHTPGRFHGDLLLLSATLDRAEVEPMPEARRPYVKDTIDSHDMTTRHNLMSQPQSLAQIDRSWRRSCRIEPLAV